MSCCSRELYLSILVATAMIWGSGHLSFGDCGPLPGIPVLHWDSPPALHAFCRVMSPKCRPDQDLLRLKAFAGLSLPSGRFCAPDTGGSCSCQPGCSLPSSACDGRPTSCLLYCLGFSLLSRSSSKRKRSTCLILFQFSPVGWEILEEPEYTYTCLYLMRLYTLETSFLNRVLCLLLLLCIFLSQQGIVTRGRRQIWNVQWWSLPRNLEKYEVTQQMSYLREDYIVGLMFFYQLSASLTFT